MTANGVPALTARPSATRILQQRAAVCRRDLGRHLVGFHFQDRLILLDRVAFLLEPPADFAFDNTFAQLGHHNLSCHLDLLIPGQLADRVGDLFGVGHEPVLQRMAERHGGHVRAAQAHHRAIQVFERFTRDDGRDLGAVTHRQVVFVDDERLAGLFAPSRGSSACPPGDRPQVHHLDADAFLRHLFCRLQAIKVHHAVSEHAEVGALARDLGRADGHRVIAIGHVAFDQAVAFLRLKEQHRVRLAHRGL